jgi:hypothetical protein
MSRIFRGPLNSIKNSKAFFDSLNSIGSPLTYFSSFVNGSNVFTDNPNFTESSCEEPECKGCSCDGGPTSWRIIETAYEVIYEENSITNNSLSGLPATYSPPPYDYTGFMELQVFCEESGWQTLDSWTTLNSEPVKTFENNYSNPCCENGPRLNT